MKKAFVFIKLLFLCSVALAEGPLFQQKDPSIQQEFENVYQDIKVAKGTGTVEGFVSSSATVTNLITSTITTTSINGTYISGFRNRIINGDMRLDQRNEGAAATVNTTNVYGVDRFVGTSHAGGSVFTIQRQTATPPPGFTHYIKLVVTSSETVSADRTYSFNQRIEGPNVRDFNFGNANASASTLQFWVKSSSAGTYAGTYRNSAQNRVYIFNYSVSSANVWEKKSVTVPGDTSGTWLTSSGSVGLRVSWDIGAGSNFKGTANTWTSSNLRSSSSTVQLIALLQSTWNITGVQVEIGNVASNFEFVGDDITLLRSQPYHWKTFDPGTAEAASAGNNGALCYRVSNGGANNNGVWLQYPATMIAAPTFTFYNTEVSGSSWRNVSDAATSGTATTGTNLGRSSAFVNNGQVAGDGAAEIVCIQAAADSEL